MPKTTLRAGLLAIAALMPGAASAHTGHDVVPGFASGIAHPFAGSDHLLAMFAVGILAASLGGRSVWALPATFVTAMAIGGLLATTATPLPYVEIMIAASVVVLGLAITTRRQFSAAGTAALVATFAVFHGYAHGSEAPAGSSLLLYGLGFLASTAALHGLGVAAGLSALRAANGRRLVTAGGAALSAAGMAMLYALT